MRIGDTRFFLVESPVPHSVLLFLFFRYNMNVIMATMTKIITSHFAISIVKPAIPRMPRIKNTKASIRKTTAR